MIRQIDKGGLQKKHLTRVCIFFGGSTKNARTKPGASGSDFSGRYLHEYIYIFINSYIHKYIYLDLDLYERKVLGVIGHSRPVPFTIL